MENEIWIPVLEFEKYYSVSNFGRVKSHDRTLNIVTKKSTYTKKLKERILNPTKEKDGYLQIGLHLEGQIKTVKVHRLVCVAFHDNPESKPQVNHKDGDKTNNNDWNVEWSTDVENKKHANETGLSRYLTGKDHRLTGTDGITNAS